MELPEGWQFAVLGFTSKQRHIIRDDAGLPLCNRHGKLERTGQFCEARSICRNCYNHRDSPFKYRVPTDNLPTMSRQHRRVYLASLIDNNGYLLMEHRRCGIQVLHYRMRTKSPALLGWLSTYVGGRIYPHNGSKEWAIQGNEAAQILVLVVEFMIKRPEEVYEKLRDFRRYKIERGRVTDAETAWFHFPKSRVTLLNEGD